MLQVRYDVTVCPALCDSWLMVFLLWLDEAFMLVLLENNWKRWTDMARTGNDKNSRVPTLYTASPNPSRNANDDARSATDESEDPVDQRNQFSGWSARGLARFNHFVDLLARTRPYRHNLEAQFLDIWRKQNTELEKLARKRRKMESDQMTAHNTLFQAIGNTHPEDVDARDDPYGDVTTVVEL